MYWMGHGECVKLLTGCIVELSILIVLDIIYFYLILSKCI